MILTVSLFSEEHDGAVMVTPSGKEIGLDHENGFSFMQGNFFVSDDAETLFIYDGEFYIEQLESKHFLMQIENEFYSSTNLYDLEKILFDWID